MLHSAVNGHTVFPSNKRVALNSTHNYVTYDQRCITIKCVKCVIK